MTTSLVKSDGRHALSAPATDPFKPSNSGEAMELAKMMAKDCSGIIPKQFSNNPAAVFMVLRMCSRLELDPLLAIQHIAVINGKLCLYGDLVWAIVSQYSDDTPIEEATGTIEGKNRKWVVRIQRRGWTTPSVGEFSYELAKSNGYLSKPGQWSTNPDLMIKWRARHFAARTAFADILSGLSFREEVEDYGTKDARTGGPADKPDVARTIDAPREPTPAASGDGDAATAPGVASLMQSIRSAPTLDALKAVKATCRQHWDTMIATKAERDGIHAACAERTKELRDKEAGRSAKAITEAFLDDESGDANDYDRDAPGDAFDEAFEPAP